MNRICKDSWDSFATIEGHSSLQEVENHSHVNSTRESYHLMICMLSVLRFTHGHTLGGVSLWWVTQTCLGTRPAQTGMKWS